MKLNDYLTRLNSGEVYTAFSNSYNYVPVGYIEDTIGLADALGSGSVTVTFSASSLKDAL